MWFAATGVLTTIFLIISRWKRPSLGIGVVIFLAILLPVWLQLSVVDAPSGTIVGGGIDPRVAIGTIALILFCFLPRAEYSFGLTACDLGMLGLVLVHLVSDWSKNGPDAGVPMRIYAEWWVPYVCGRLAIQTRADLRRLLPLAVSVATCLAIVSIVEGISRVNLFEVVWGLRPPEQNPRMLFRWGLKRAYGPCLNPVYFGTLQLLLFAWPTVIAIRALESKAHLAWLLPLPICVAGIICTGSRGPILALAIFSVACIFALTRKPRPWIAAMAFVMVLLATTQRETLLATFESWSRETQHSSNANKVVIDGKTQEYSSTRNRLLLYDLYSIAMKRSGLLGFGTEAVTGFPVRVPLGPQEVETLRKIRFVDNTYILLTLRFGYLGLMCFVFAGIAAIGQFYFVVQKCRSSGDSWSAIHVSLAACLGASLAATLVVLLTVWMPQDHGFIVLWTMGASSGLMLASRADAKDGRARLSG